MVDENTAWITPILKSVDQRFLDMSNAITANLKYVDQRFLDSATAVAAALQAAEKAVSKAEIATDKRFDQLTEDADRRSRESSIQISNLEASMNSSRGSSSTSQRLWALLLPVLVSLFAISAGVFIAIYK